MADALLSLDEFLPYRLSYTSNLVSERIAQVYQSLFAISIPEWRMIAVIAEQGSVTQREICARTGMDKVSVSRAAIALERRKLLARSPNAGDGRSHKLSLTGAGQTLYDNIAPKALEMDAQVFACLTRSERATLMGLLRRVDAGLDG